MWSSSISSLKYLYDTPTEILLSSSHLSIFSGTILYLYTYIYIICRLNDIIYRYTLLFHFIFSLATRCLELVLFLTVIHILYLYNIYLYRHTSKAWYIRFNRLVVIYCLNGAFSIRLQESATGLGFYIKFPSFRILIDYRRSCMGGKRRSQKYGSHE